MAVEDTGTSHDEARPAQERNAEANYDLSEATDKKKPPFKPNENPELPTGLELPDELWQMVLDCPCSFESKDFDAVMLNLINNPNITSSHLFRADIFYDSNQDKHFDERNLEDPYGRGIVQHLKPEYRPIKSMWPGLDLCQTVVRQLVPRNPQLDKPMIQTCHVLGSVVGEGDEERCLSVVQYIPHVEKSEDMPFYHPEVSQLAFLHESWNCNNKRSNSLKLLYRPFSKGQLSTKLTRTALKLLQTAHKHGEGHAQGYSKRVHLDQIIPQKQYQDTYSILKTKYGRKLSEQWVEVTDPGKHVFEDIAIAAYLIGIWKEIYQPPHSLRNSEEEVGYSKPPFPGFIDIGCGNGLLTSILLSEGYPGTGIDARTRKTWSIFPPEIQQHLHRKILIPKVFQQTRNLPDNPSQLAGGEDGSLRHNGTFPAGTFMISNHADELTTWTPLLAYLNSSPFLAIPCCSHDLSGARFRAPIRPKSSTTKDEQPHHLPQQEPPTSLIRKGNAAETGSLRKSSTTTTNTVKPPSAYSTLCNYVSYLSLGLGFETETDVLRIPSTRNTCIIGGRKGVMPGGSLSEEEKERVVVEVVEREMKRKVEVVGKEWIERAEKLTRKPGSGH